MRGKDHFPVLAFGILVAAGLCTLLVRGGWLVWFPVPISLAVVAVAWDSLSC